MPQLRQHKRLFVKMNPETECRAGAGTRLRVRVRMNNTFKATMDMLRAVSRAASLKISRNWADYLADQIVKASGRASLLSAVETLAESVQADVEYVSNPIKVNFMRVINANDAPAVLSWLRKNAKIAAMLLTLKDKDGEEFDAALAEIELTGASDLGVSRPRAVPEIPMTLTCLSELSHGGDQKAGNSTLFRRVEILSTTDNVLTLPQVSANSFRGLLRRELSVDWLTRVGLSPSRSLTPLSVWFYHALFSGGALEENSAVGKALAKEMGASGTMRVKGIHQFRDMCVPLSVMGVSVGNRILCRHGFDAAPAIPRCREWGTGAISEANLFTWTFITRRDDAELRPITDDAAIAKSQAMIANTECLMAGTVLDGGVSLLEGMTDIERSCVGKALFLLQKRGKIGANNRYWQGRVDITFGGDVPDPQPYETYMEERKSDILAYLQEIGALKNAPHPTDLFSVDETA